MTMRKPILLIFLIIGYVNCQQARSIGLSRRHRRPASKAEIVDFNCPEDFGYYPHATDCSMYYVCVFGGALLESCTGGLMYSHELQTCDWPRNVVCNLKKSGSGISTIQITDPRTQATNKDIRTATEALTPSVSNLGRKSVNSINSFGNDKQPSIDLLDEKLQRTSNRFFSSRQMNPFLSQPIPQDTIGQETTNRVVNFNPTTTSPTLPPTSRPRVSPTTTDKFTDFYSDYNFDSDYYYLYDEILDFYDTLDAKTTPAPKLSATRSPSSRARQPKPSQSTETSRGRLSSTSRGTSPSASSILRATSSSLQSTPNSSTRGRSTTFSNPTSKTARTNSLSRSQTLRQSFQSTPTTPKSFPNPKLHAFTSTSVTSSSSFFNPTSSRASSNSDRVKVTKQASFSVIQNDKSNSKEPLSSATPRSSSVRSPTSTKSKQKTNFNQRQSTRKSNPPGPAATDDSIPKRPAPTRPQPPFDTKASKCDPKVCQLPDCYCGGKDVPGGLSPEQIPQIVLLTFDDSVNELNRKHYSDLFEQGRKNPNGCPISATFYVSHEWTDYSHVQNLYADGHEMASHSITHSFGEQFSTLKWAREISGQREILSAYGGVKMEDVRGMRAPYLAIGGNKMFKMLYEQNYTYDSSMPVYENKPPSWPYTLDYRIFHDCMIPPCPTNSYPGVWEVPMVMWQDLNGGRCSMGDACTTPPDAEGVYQMLVQNFQRHYTSNRSPFGLFYHAAWFTTKPHHKEGFLTFLDAITNMDDVWIITNWQALQWVRNPVPLSQLHQYKPWQCDYPDRPKRCNSPKVCNVWHKGGVRYMRTCQQCPDTYPWTGNTGVPSPLNGS